MPPLNLHRALVRIMAGVGIGALCSGCRPAGVAFAPVAQAGPVVPAASTSTARFRDIAEQAGLNYKWQIAGKRPLNILQTIGNGCAFLDYDNDGNLDILLVGPKLALYKGDGKGHFTDVTQAMGLGGLSGHFLGCAVSDYDNDGWPDIYISAYRGGVLLHNEGGKGYKDVTRQAGLGPQPWGTSCAWAETVPGSGRLDLFVANYARFGPEPDIPQLCESHGLQTSCGPAHYKPLPGAFYRNLGGGRFARADSALALASTHGRGLGAAFAPLDENAPPTLAIANDETFGDLLTPRLGLTKASTGAGSVSVRYVNSASAAGVAGDRDGNIHGGMGTDWGDYDNDGRLDLFVATFQGEAKSLYHNDGGGAFSDAAYLTGIAPITMPNVAFGCKLFDYDNDGNLDLLIANGHVQDNIGAIEAGNAYRQTPLLLHNRGGRPVTFENVSGMAGADFARPLVGRGLAVGDFDNDGRVDVLIVDSEGSPLLLHNETGNQTGNETEGRPAQQVTNAAPGPTATPTHWLGVSLIGTHSNRDGIGATLTASVGARRLTQLCHTDGSYLSASDKRVHFGLGAAAVVESLTVHWPDGQSDTWKNIAANHYITLKEGTGIHGGI